MNEKYFNRWHKVKKQINRSKNVPTFKEREVWWCSIGQNIGFESYGKGDSFWRPVLILTKHNQYTFFGLPLTSSHKIKNPHYYPFPFQGQEGSILLSQGRTLSSLRLVNHMGWVTPTQYSNIKEAFKNQI